VFGLCLHFGAEVLSVWGTFGLDFDPRRAVRLHEKRRGGRVSSRGNAGRRRRAAMVGVRNRVRSCSGCAVPGLGSIGGSVAGFASHNLRAGCQTLGEECGARPWFDRWQRCGLCVP
jgi:hypothetical protein